MRRDPLRRWTSGGNASRSMRIRLVLALALIVVAPGGCRSGGTADPWSQTFVPTSVAVIDDAEYTGGEGGRNVRLHLASGQVLDRDLNQLMQVDPSNSPRPGDLWITGAIGGREWYYAVPHEGDCWVLVSEAQDLGSDVWFRFGLRLPKSDGFESPGIPSLNMQGGVKFCLNDRGEVVKASLA
jgi:hypothetical protein